MVGQPVKNKRRVAAGIMVPDLEFIIIMLAAAEKKIILSLRVLAWISGFVLRHYDLGQPRGAGLAVFIASWCAA